MQIILEVWVLLSIFILYWCNRERRRYLKERIGSKALMNIYAVGRNISFMLMKKKLRVKGDMNSIERGGILYSFHFGVWELMPWALKKLGYNLGIIVNRYSDDKKNITAFFFDKFLYWFRSFGNVKIFYKEDTMKIVNFIKNGGLLGVLVDGNRFYSKFEKAQKLSHLCNVALVPFAAYRKKGIGILEIGCDLDEIVEQRPFDYVWFYKSREAR